MSQITQNPSAPANTRSTTPARRESPEFRVPAVNIHQNADGYTLLVEMPGVAKSGVDVTFEDGKLTLTGRREEPANPGNAVYREIERAGYRRVFDLDPSIDSEKIEAAIDQGLLRVRLPRAETAKPRRIEIA